MIKYFMNIKRISLVSKLVLLSICCFFAKSVCAQSAEETINLLNKLFAEHCIGATNFSFKKVSENEIVATTSVTVRNYGAEKLTYRFNPKNAISIKSIVSKNNATIIFTFKENSVEWFDRHLKIETLSKIQCSLIRIRGDDIDLLLRSYKYLIESFGGTLKGEI